jgi:hypothetical protein
MRLPLTTSGIIYGYTTLAAGVIKATNAIAAQRPRGCAAPSAGSRARRRAGAC